MEQRESAARQALRKKRARKRAVRTAVFLALAAALGAAAAFVILPQMNGEAADNAPQTLSNWNMICRPHSRKCALRRHIRSMSIKNSMTRTAICVTM